MLKRTLKKPSFATTVQFSPNFNHFDIPHFGPTEAEHYIAKAEASSCSLVFFSEIELRIFNLATLGQASLLCCYPRLPSRTLQYFGDIGLLKEALDMCMLEGLLLLNIPLFRTTQLEWNAASSFFESTEIPDTFPHPLLPLYRMGRLSLKDRLQLTTKHFGHRR
jgi:hypothetical protein